MFQNVHWKLTAVLVVIAVAVMIAIMGLPGGSGTFGSLKLGTDLKGGTRLVYSIHNVEIEQMKDDIAALLHKQAREGTLTEDDERRLENLKREVENKQEEFDKKKESEAEKVCDILRKRLDASKLGGILIRPYGGDRVQIVLPGHIEFTENIKSMIRSSGQLFWRMEAEKEYKGTINYPDLPKNAAFGQYRWFPMEGQERDAWDKDEAGNPVILIEWRPVDYPFEFLTGERLVRIEPTRGRRHEHIVAFTFEDRDKRKFGDFTYQFMDDNYPRPADIRRLCVIFNEKVFWAGNIKSRIDGEGVMEGFAGAAEQMEMVNLLRAGSMSVNLKIESQNETGAELGHDSIRQGVIAIIIGGVLVLVFILFYYLGVGIIANLALVMNLFILLGIMVLLQATLTLPGIAGIILTVGMAIDANILIFERIREEKKKTGNLKDAVQRGFDRAIVTILDAQITTILIGIILALVGTDAVKGFAITIIIGIAASLFTSLLFSRYLIGFLIKKEVIKRFAMLQMLGKTEINFLKGRAPLFTISTILIILGLSLFGARGEQNLGIDFLGGHEFHIQLQEEADVDSVRSEFAKLTDETGAQSYPDLRIISASSRGRIAVGSVSREFVLTFPSKPDESDTHEEVVKRLIRNDINRIFDGAQLPKLVDPGVQPIVGESKVMQYKIVIPLVEGLNEEILEKFRVSAKVLFDSFIPSDKGSIQDLQDLADVTPTGEDLEAETTPRPFIYLERTETDLVFYLINVAVNWETYNQDAFAVSPQLLGLIEEFKDWHKDDVKFSDEKIEIDEFPMTGELLVEFRFRPEFEKEDFIENFRSEILNAVKDKSIGEMNFDNSLISSDVVRRVDKKSGLLADSKGYYNLLGLSNDASDDEIKSVIEKLSAQAQASNQMQLLAKLEEAKETLTDKEKRSEYDRIINGFIISIGEFKFASLRDEMRDAHPRNVLQQIDEAVKGYLNPEDPTVRGDDYIPRMIPSAFLRQEGIGQTIASDLQEQATWGIIISLVLIVLYIWIRFRKFRFGLGATMALAHDVLFAVGAIAFFDAIGLVNVKIDLTVIAALLTIIGYSLNDTIVVFDRIRENLVGTKKEIDIKPYINTAINQTLSRTILTSMTTFVVVFVLLLFGTQVLEGFAFTLAIGILIGTYSSIFVASPILTVNWLKVRKIIIIAGFVGFILGGIGFYAAGFGFPIFGGNPFLTMVTYSVILMALLIWFYSAFEFYRSTFGKDKTRKKSSKKELSTSEPKSEKPEKSDEVSEKKDDSDDKKDDDDDDDDDKPSEDDEKEKSSEKITQKQEEKKVEKPSAAKKPQSSQTKDDGSKQSSKGKKKKRSKGKKKGKK